MSQDGKCPRCDFKAPMVAFSNGGEDGRICAELIKLPPQVQNYYFAYLSLFRPKSGCAMQGKKALRLTQELINLVTKGYVGKKGQVDRPSPPSIWGIAIEKMLEQSGLLTLPMENHNYLKSIAYTLADRADAGLESSRGKSRIYQSTNTDNPVRGIISGMFNGLSPSPKPAESEEMRMERQDIISRMTSGEITPEAATEEHEALTKKYRS